MSSSTRIIAAFAIGTAAGALLGLLLQSSGDEKSLAKESSKDEPSWFDRLFGTAKHFKPSPQDSGEFEQA